MTDLQTAMTAALTRTVDDLNKNKLSDVYRELGISNPAPERNTQWETLSRADVHADSRRMIELAQSAIGKPGTHISDGFIEVEHNARLKPWKTRGRIGKPGLNEEVYRTEPVVFKSVNEIAALICNASYEPYLPDSLDESVRVEVTRQHQSIRRTMLRDDFLNNASSFVKHGFAFFEVLWDTDNPTVAGLQFREQASVYRWIFDDRQAQWLATEFQTGGTDAEHYVIPNGNTLATSRSLLVNLHAHGLNLEGVSPIRVIIGLRKLKELILQSFGVSYQKYAVPIATIIHDTSEAAVAILNTFQAGEHKGEIQELINRIQNIRGRLGAVLPIPAGYRLEYQNPTVDMPDPKPILDYLDMMMALVFANEGALLGSQSFGSYAMAKTSDEKFMRSAPVYAERIASSLTKLLHTGLELNGVDLNEVEELPCYGFRFNGTQDASKYLGDLVAVMSAAPGTWPEEIRRAAAARLGLPADAFDNLEAPAAPPLGEEE